MNFSNQDLFGKCLSRFRRLFYREVVDCWAQCDFGIDVKPPKLAANEKIVVTDVDDFSRYHDRFELDLYAEFKRRTEHSVGVIMFVDGDYATSCWFTNNERKLEGDPPLVYAVRPKPGQAYVYDAFTKPERRNKRHFYKLSRATLLEIQSRGYDGICINFDAHQPKWMDYYKRLGFYKLGEVSYRRRLFFVERDLRLLDEICDSPRVNPTGYTEDQSPASIPIVVPAISPMVEMSSHEIL